MSELWVPESARPEKDETPQTAEVKEVEADEDQPQESFPVTPQEIQKAQAAAIEVVDTLDSPGAWVAFFGEESILKMTSEWLAATLPDMITQAVNADRMAIIRNLQRTLRDHNLAVQATGRGTPLETQRIKPFLDILMQVMQSVPAPRLQMQIERRVENTSSSESGDESEEENATPEPVEDDNK